MDLLIKNVRLPKKNGVLWLAVASDGTVEEGYGQIPETKAVEVNPHRRLIDADKLRGEVNYLICTDCEMESCEDCDVEWCKRIIENAPTVLGG